MRQTKLPMEYQPGKSRLLYFTSTLISRDWTDGDDYMIKIGLYSTNSDFTSKEGHYIATDGKIIYWVETHENSERYIPQSEWNYDKFDGTGRSKKILTINNFKKEMLFVIDQEWLGIGRVRLGFNIGGIIYYAHQFTHNNTTPYPYTSTPKLPITYQIKATTLSEPIEMRQLWSSCITECGAIPGNKRFSANIGIDGLIINSSSDSDSDSDSSGSDSDSSSGSDSDTDDDDSVDYSNKYILMALKLRSGVDFSIIRPHLVNILFPNGSDSNWLQVEMQLHSSIGPIGSINGSLEYTDVKYSAGQYAKGNGSDCYVVDDGIILTTFFIKSKKTYSVAIRSFEAMYTTSQISEYDTLYVVGRSNSKTNIDPVLCSIDYSES